MRLCAFALKAPIDVPNAANRSLDSADASLSRRRIPLAGTSPVSTPPLIAVVGPTASGKSDLGLALAQEYGGEIINCDSVQVYRGINVATAKVPPEERRGIPHHLIDIVEPTVNLTAVAWAGIARETIKEIEARGRRVFLVGGTGFYLRALTTRLCDAPEIDDGLRPRLQRILEKRGAGHLHAMLKRVDPVLGQRYASRDWSRIVRALEVYFSSGTPLAVWQRRSPEEPTPEAQRLHFLVLDPPRGALYERINRRADQMIGRGLVEEVRGLIASGVPTDAKAFSAHGYRRIVEYLLGERSLEDAIEQMKLDTRHYAKRQWTWWRRQPKTHWLAGFGDDESVIDDAKGVVATIDQSEDRRQLSE